ncbi:NYN domain-containing protein [bacterium]|nr:MAG: NYN domain-containing protein [bacterium]RLJ05397.1 MAG: NYN domain-containing protein [Candidatus Aenigmarchaeota archaeon]
MSKRAMVFIDGNNLYFGLKKNVGNYNLNYEKFLERLTEKYDLIRGYFYTALFKKEDDERLFNNQQKFLTYLMEVPYMQVVTGRMERRGDDLIEKGVDVQLAIDLVRFGAEKVYDVGFIVTGDGDYAPAVEAVKDMGLNVISAFFPFEVSIHLKHVCDKFIALDYEYLRDCLFASSTPTFIRNGIESRAPEDVEREFYEESYESE